MSTYLESAITRKPGSSRDHQGPRAVLNALERLANGYGPESVRVRQNLAIAESQLRDYQARLGKPFPHDKYLNELTDLRDQLKVKLSASAHHSDEERGPAAAELADRIKALKSANTIETTPQRARQKQSSAEEPITARIRRRQDAHAAAAEPVQNRDLPDTALPLATEPANDNHHADNDNRPLSFAERIAKERQRQDQTPRIP